MKNKSLRNIFALALILFTVFGCSRYEEGPCMSFRSAGKRLTHTIWDIQLVKKNNLDITEDVRSHFSRISFSGNQDEYSNIVGLDLFNGSVREGFGQWYFSDNEYNENDYSKLTMHLISFPGDTMACYPFPSDQYLVFIITRLTMKDLWLEHTDSLGNVYVIKFESI